MQGWTGANDWQAWDNTEAVTIIPAANGPAVAVSAALRRAPQYVEQAASKGVYVAARLPWMIPNILLGGYKIQPADVLADAANVAYTILRSNWVGVSQAWRLETVDLFL